MKVRKPFFASNSFIGVFPGNIFVDETWCMDERQSVVRCVKILIKFDFRVTWYSMSNLRYRPFSKWISSIGYWSVAEPSYGLWIYKYISTTPCGALFQLSSPLPHEVPSKSAEMIVW